MEKSYELDHGFIDLVLYSPVEQLRVPGNTVFIAERTDKLVEVFKGLMKYNFLSVPILQKTGRKYYGFLDMGDIVRYVCDVFGSEKLEETKDFWQLIEKEENFRNVTVKEVMRHPMARNNPFHPVKGGYSLFAALEVLARERRLHCVAVVDDDRNLLNLVTQSQLLRFVVEHSNKLGRKREKTVQDMGTLREVYVIGENEPAINAFKMMSEKEVSGLGVVDDKGILVETISLRDLKAMAPDAGMFWRLFGTVKAFLAKITIEFPGSRPSTLQTCSVTDTFGDIVKRMEDHKIHRIFVTDNSVRPIGVVTLKDVLYQLVQKD